VSFGSAEAATAKARELVRMAVARAGTLTPLHEKKIPVNQRALVVGGGVSGMNAALGLADQGFEVVIVEKEERVGRYGPPAGENHRRCRCSGICVGT
jgi:heterodisulfide reductase subunit A-like polyferredoxin